MTNAQSETVAAPSPTIDFEGVWHSQRGSEMVLEVIGTTITGTYRTKIGDPKFDDRFVLTGFVTGDLISFTVNFGKFGTLAAWVGEYTATQNAEGLIQAVFVTAINSADDDETEYGWGCVRTGADTFTRASGI